jgi:meso-butanediol dehydrogenase/(S,S)-butanediol dehydrogenase/diacetyl reductase
MTLKRFEDKVVFVTGGSSGLGADTCELFIQEGATVFVTDIAERGILKRLGTDKATFQHCDVSKHEDCEKAVAICIERFGRLDVLFHNGARLAGVATVVDHDVTLFQQVINTNLCGLFYLARVVIPQMRKQGKGAIVSTASTSGLAGDYGLCSYSAAKAGLVNLTRVMALDHAQEGIRVNCVCPGYMVTPMTAPFRENETVHEVLLESIPMHRGSDPKEVGRTILFLASDDASYITGQGESRNCSLFPSTTATLSSALIRHLLTPRV